MATDPSSDIALCNDLESSRINNSAAVSPAEDVVCDTSPVPLLEIWKEAVERYKELAGKSLLPVLDMSDPSSDWDAFFDAINNENKKYKDYAKCHEKLREKIEPVLRITRRLAGAIAEAAGDPLATFFHPVKAIPLAVKYLIEAAEGAVADYDNIIELFDRMYEFLARMKIYETSGIQEEMRAVLVDSLAHVLKVLGEARKAIKKRFISKMRDAILTDKTKTEALLNELDKLSLRENSVVSAVNFKGVNLLLRRLEILLSARDETKDMSRSIERQLQELLHHEHATATEIRQDLSSLNMFNQQTAETLAERQLVDRINNWLSAPDPSSNQKLHFDSRHEETGRWFLNGEMFKWWKHERKSSLWLNGSAGCGKSVLCSSVIDNVRDICSRDPSSILLYYYMDFSEKSKQTYDGLLRSLATQLANWKSSPCREVFQQLIKDYPNQTTLPSNDSLCNVIELVCAPASDVYLIVDALDESSSTDRSSILNFVASLRSISNLHILVTSRPDPDIQYGIQTLLSINFKHDTMNIESEAVSSDLERYVTDRIQHSHTLQRLGNATSMLIKSSLIERAGGMFRWAALQLDDLCRCRTQKAVKSTLEKLPLTLAETYTRMLGSVQPDDLLYLNSVLAFILHADGQLTADQIATATAVNLESLFLDSDIRLLDPEHIVALCPGLMILTEDQKGVRIRLAHFSVREYLESSHVQTFYGLTNLEPVRGHRFIAMTCLLVLTQLDDALRSCEDMCKAEPLAEYAARTWSQHLHSASISLEHDQPVNLLLTHLFDWEKTAFGRWIYLYDVDLHSRSSSRQWPVVTDPQVLTTIHCALLYAVHAGLRSICKHLIEAGANPNHTIILAVSRPSPLMAACYHGHMDIIELLLDHKADVNHCIADVSDRHGNALQAAACQGHVAIVQLLIERGADVHVQGGKYGATLQAAAYEGQDAIVRLLLERGADANAQGGYYGTALQSATAGGNEAIVRMLIEHDADVDAQGGEHGNALQAAAYRGHDAIVRLLLDRGADVNARGGHHGTALQAAADGRNDVIVQLLLECGADVNAQGGAYGSALQAATDGGNVAIVRLFIERGADVNAQGGEYGTALQVAAYGGQDEIVELLLNHGADINAQGGVIGSALQAAAYGGQNGIVQLLLKRGANVNTQGGAYGTALQAATDGGNEAIVRLFIERGADVNAQGGEYGTALQAAACRGQEAIVRLLLECGADVHARGGHYGTALQAAAYQGHDMTVRLLLERGADVNAQGGFYGTALQAAACRSHNAIVQLLLDYGADVNAQGGAYGNALQSATDAGSGAIVRLLIGRGADVNVQGGEYGTALQVAAYGGQDEIVELLLNHGADVNAQGGVIGSALQAASTVGAVSVVRLLLERGAQVNSQDDIKEGSNDTALQAAAHRGHHAIVLLLLEYGADVNVQGGKVGSALHAASAVGAESVVRLLLERGAHVNIHDGLHDTALQAAAYQGHHEVARLLLDHGADVDVQGGKVGSALHAASAVGAESVVRLLLEHGASVDIQDRLYGTALQIAASNCDGAIVQLLLDHGAEYGTTMQAAIEGGHYDIVRLLLDHGADVNVDCGVCGSALQAAVSNECDAIVNLLLYHGAEYANTLEAAAEGGFYDIVRILLDSGADANVHCKSYGSALQAAVLNGQDAVVGLLLDHGAVLGDCHLISVSEPFETVRPESSSGGQASVQDRTPSTAQAGEPDGPA